MKPAPASHPLPRPALVWNRDDYLDAAEAIEQHSEVRKIRGALNSIVAQIDAANIDLLAPHIEELQALLERAKDHAAAAFGLQWARRIRL